MPSAIVEILISTAKQGPANACFFIGLVLLIFLLAFDRINSHQIKNRKSLIGLAVLLLLASFVVYIWPYIGVRTNANNLGGNYSLDWGKLDSLFFTKNGELQVHLEGGFPEANKAFHGDDKWPNGDRLPAAAKQALISAKASGVQVGIMIRGFDSSGKKYLIDEIYMGGPVR